MADTEDILVLAVIVEKLVELVDRQMISLPIRTVQDLRPLIEELEHSDQFAGLTIGEVEQISPPGVFPIDSLGNFLVKCHLAILNYHVLFQHRKP